MILNYLKLAWRHLHKNKLYSLVNLLGLTIGITGCLLIGTYNWHKWSYDSFHEKSDRIVRVTWEYKFNDEKEQTASTGTRVGPEFTRRFPEIQSFVRLLKIPRVVALQDKQFEEKNFFYADSTFFEIFSFELLQGNSRSVLDEPSNIVITQSIAEKYFGNEPALGKVLTVGGTKDYKVTGIVKNVPDNSQIKFDFILPFSNLTASESEKWNEANYLTYLLLNDPGDLQTLQNKIHSYMDQVGREEYSLTGDRFLTYHLQPITQVHLRSNLDGFEPNSNIIYLWILAGVAFLILLIACVNYTNLSIAQAAGRGSEIAMRKVLGAGKKNIFFQFMSESFLMTLIAFICSLLLGYFLMPYFNDLAGTQISTELLFQPLTFLLLLILTVLVAFLAGAYPALVLSHGRVIGLLKKGFSFSGFGLMRKTLIVFQFVISIFLLITTVVIIQQLEFLQNKDLGYNKNQVLILPIDAQIRKNYDQIRSTLLEVPGVTSIAAAYEDPTHIGWGDAVTSSEGNKNITVNAMPVDEHITSSLGIEIIAGEDFTNSDIKLADPELHGDDITYTYMLNASAARALGWTPQEAVGKRIAKGREGVVRAVVKDFHFRSLHEPIGPLVLFMDKRLTGAMLVKISDTRTNETLSDLEKVWKSRVPHRPFEYQFLDENYAALYRAEQSIAGVFTTFSAVAILLACLGLFALTAYVMASRSKEIGIRKILGASVPNILSLVSKDFAGLVLMAIIIGVPVSLFAVDRWLEAFSYRINIAWWVIGMACVFTLLIALITVWLQAIRAAMSKPVQNLKNL